MTARPQVALASLVATLAACSGAQPEPSGGTTMAKTSATEPTSQVKVSEVMLPPARAPSDTAPKDPRPEDKPPAAAQTENMAGRLSAESVEAAVGASGDLLGRCTTSYATVSARILVAANGQVIDANVGQSSPDDARMRDCVVAALKKMKFASSGDTVPLSFRLAINPASELR
jgi:hypothetical protein